MNYHVTLGKYNYDLKKRPTQTVKWSRWFWVNSAHWMKFAL